MVDMKLTPKAFELFYAKPFVVLVGESVGSDLASFLPTSCTVLSLAESGTVYPIGEEDKADETSLKPVGIGLGFRAIIHTRKEEKAAAKWQYYADKQAPHSPVLSHIYKKWRPLALRRCQAFLLDMLLAESGQNTGNLGEAQKKLVHLRQRNEQLLLGMEKARRMMQGIGFGTESLVLELPPSLKKVGPNAIGPDDICTSIFLQKIPVDASALVSLSLFFADDVKDHVSPEAGHMDIRLLGVADQAELAKLCIGYDHLVSGWNKLEISLPVERVVGDACLELSWHDKGQLGPAVMLSSVLADRFGTEAGDTLALRLFNGLPATEADFDEMLGRCGSAVEEGSISVAPYILPAEIYPMQRVTSFKFPELFGRIEFLHGGAALSDLSAKLGFSPLLVSDETGSLQTHPLSDILSAAVMPLGAPAGVTSLNCQVETAHSAAPDFLYVLILVTDEQGNKKEIAEKVFEQARRLERAADTGGSISDGYLWSARRLKAKTPARLALELDMPLANTGDLIFAVGPLSDSVSYGWCRWYSLNYIRHAEDDGVARSDKIAD